MVRERTHAGLAAARDRGGKFGRQGCRLHQGEKTFSPSSPKAVSPSSFS